MLCEQLYALEDLNDLAAEARHWKSWALCE